MKGSHRALCLLAAVWMTGASALAAPRAAGPFEVGRRLDAAIEDLRAQGLAVVYSSDLVRPAMRVMAEPVSSAPRAILEELVAPHGLRTSDGPDGTVLVVRHEDASGPTGGVDGRVVGAADRSPVAGARVVVGDVARSTTAGDGRFLAFHVPAGTITIEVVSADGRMRQVADLLVESGTMTRVVIAIASAETAVEGVVVTPTRYRLVGGDPEARLTLDDQDVARLAHLGDDAHRAAGRLPGTAVGDKSARLSMRGGEWNEVLVRLDGLEIDNSLHLDDFLSFSGIVDSRAIESADLLNGGFPAEFGDRMSGVIDLTSSVPDTAVTSLSAGSLASRIMTRGRTEAGAGRWLFSARSWYPDAVLDLVDPGGEDINPYYYDMLGKYETRLDSGTTISGHVLASRDLVNFDEPDIGREVRARYARDYVWMNLATPWSPRLHGVTRLSYGRSASTREGSSVDASSKADVDDERLATFLGAEQDWVFRASDRVLWKWGFDARDVDAEYDYTLQALIDDPLLAGAAPAAVDRSVRENLSGSRLGAYAAIRLTPAEWFTSELGLRWARQSYARDRQIDPRVNLVFRPADRSALRASWGLFHQSQRIDELQVEDGVEEFFPAQRAEHRILSFEHRTRSGLRLRADAYWKVMTRLRPRYENLFNPLEIFPESEPDRVEIDPRRATARGVEMHLRSADAARFSWWFGYALSRSEDSIAGRPQPRSWDQRHAAGGGAGWRLPRGWRIDLTGAWHSGWPRTDVTARTVTDPNGMAAIQATAGRRNAERYPPYHRLDLRLARQVRLGRGDLRVVLEVLNVYDRENVCCVEDWAYATGPRGTVAVERRNGLWLRRVPSLGIEWEH